MNLAAFALSILIATLPTPVRVNDPNCERPWFRGATPPTPHNTVLVFVHGKHDDESIWFDRLNHYGHNDMYELAYKAGYKTAFVNLGSEATMWYNGRVLSEQLASIERYFNTRNIVIIAHSKGGIDAQTALIHYNSIGAPRKIISLSTPYYGSPLADLIFSHVFVTWLSLILGQATPAAFVLQTAYMYDFQDELPNDPDYQYVYYYTLSGWDIGPFPLWLGGLYLNMYGGDYAHGGNDGAVTFSSAHLIAPHATRISLPEYADHERKWYFNHFNIPMGRNTWFYIDSLIEIYPVLSSYESNKKQFSDSYKTLKITGFIKSSAEKYGDLNITLPESAVVYLLLYKDGKAYLDGRRLDNKLKSYPNTDIKYLQLHPLQSKKLNVSGEFFLLVDEKRNPLEVKYKPLVKNEIPHLQLSMGKKDYISYEIVAKSYSLNGTLRNTITLNGKISNGAYITLPFYEEGLYNITITARTKKVERTAIFSMIIKNSSSLRKKAINIQTVYLNSVKKGNFHGTIIDILGRRIKEPKIQGIFFQKLNTGNKPIIVIK